MFEPITVKAKHVAGTAGIGLAATLALCVGLIFWTLAAWIFLLTQTTPLLAAIIVAACYTGLALIGFAIVSARGNKMKAQPAPPPSFDGLMAAFMTGVKAGARTRS